LPNKKQTHERLVAGSNPAGPMFHSAARAQTTAHASSSFPQMRKCPFKFGNRLAFAWPVFLTHLC